MRRVLVVGSLLFAGVGCGKSPASPSTITTGLEMTVPRVLRMGQTTQATGTETLLAGQTRPVTSGWSSDASSIVRVTPEGLVTGVANGNATIVLESHGRRVQQPIRVVPDYHGHWTGVLRLTSCDEGGDLAQMKLCVNTAIGSTVNYTLNLSQTDLHMSAVMSYDPAKRFPSILATIRDDGQSVFSGKATVLGQGFTSTVDTALWIKSVDVGELTGSANEVWAVPGVTGFVEFDYIIVNATRIGPPLPDASAIADRSGLFGHSLSRRAH